MNVILFVLGSVLLFTALVLLHSVYGGERRLTGTALQDSMDWHMEKNDGVLKVCEPTNIYMVYEDAETKETYNDDPWKLDGSMRLNEEGDGRFHYYDKPRISLVDSLLPPK